jgi:prepilin signal peptidase PulO-like enzyme (type II secretory pathway)
VVALRLTFSIAPWPPLIPSLLLTRCLMADYISTLHFNLIQLFLKKTPICFRLIGVFSFFSFLLILAMAKAVLSLLDAWEQYFKFPVLSKGFFCSKAF